MIREASIYTLKKLSAAERESYGTRVLTMRRWPRGIARKDVDLWVPSAGPSVELLTVFHTGEMTWEQFLIRYLEEQERQERCRVVSYEQRTPHAVEYAGRSLDYLARLEQEGGTVTVLCWEQDEHCHRFTLAQRLSERASSSIQKGEKNGNNVQMQ